MLLLCVPDIYVSFDLVHLLDTVFRFSISLVLFIRILSLMRPLAINYSVFLMRATLLSTQNELLAFSIVLSIVLTAFTSLFYLLEGPITFGIRTVPDTYMTLFTSLLGLIRLRQLQFSETGIESNTKQFMFFLYFLMTTMILMNVAVSILNIDMSSIKGHTHFKVGPEFDKDLNDYLWRSLEGFFSKCWTTGQTGEAAVEIEGRLRLRACKEMHCTKEIHCILIYQAI